MANMTIVNDYEELSKLTAERLISFIQEKNDAVVCLAGGQTPLGFFKEFIKQVNEFSVLLDKVTFVGLDEWVGVNGDTVGSCRHTLNEYFFYPLEIKENQILFFDGTVTPIEKEKERVRKELNALNGIDFMVLGIGRNGHLGFNEPHVSMEEEVQIVPLEQSTIEDSGGKIEYDGKLSSGITLGMRAITSADQLIAIASGEKKASIIKKVIEGNVTDGVPASLLQKSKKMEFILDKSASQELNQ
ncbi:Glucosamine-6-phosphate deaminase 1 [Oceanobacillus oncorhynchi]|uniref:Glucosamine-6-phosphate deaminase 1 n=1 Tax=Oceanobacillus oncorhynchi TaxID=545501 RepID=A0A0A1MKP1_9BACI|nr:glucosamine-6-phosphate deaminase [Oceanobacillus oncorhynchi]CEI80404.1 Glucosamine-6-phosphate deaminase 1 [Oceanobacillus oncorhynchi]